MSRSKTSSLKLISLPFLGICIILLSSCGTAKRAEKREHKPIKTHRYPQRAEDQPVIKSNHHPVTPKTEPLVAPLEKGAEALQLIEKGKASWYGPKFNGKLTANGEQYDMYGLTAAHRTLPFNTLVLVRNLTTGKSVTVRINDRGPFAKNRIIDLSKKAAQEIGMIGPGTANVRLYVAKNALDNSKPDNLKVATYTVQLGSFDTEAKAFDYSAKVKGSRVEIIRKDNKLVYRVYYGLFISKEEAYKKQKDLEHKNISGYVKQIENG